LPGGIRQGAWFTDERFFPGEAPVKIARGLSGLACILFLAASSAAQQSPASARRAELEQLLGQRYRVTLIGPGVLGLRGGADTVRKPGTVVELRREGLHGSLEQMEPASYNVRDDRPEFFRGRRDTPLAPGEKFYVHSLYVGSDVVSLGLLSTRSVTGPGATGRLWAGLNFFFTVEALMNVDSDTVVRTIEQWVVPEGLRAVPGAAPVAAPPPPPPAPPAQFDPGATREAVVAALGTPQREVSFGKRTWLTYAGLVVLLEDGKLVTMDRSGQPPAKVVVRSEPDGADVYVDGSFVGNTPMTLELPAGNYKVSARLPGFAEWVRDLRVLPGSEVNVRARLEK
jgi:hypothetical protein